MARTKHRFLTVGALVLVFVLLLGLVYTVQRARFVQKANAQFDPKERAFTGLFLPWPLGRPSLVGSLIRSQIAESGIPSVMRWARSAPTG